MQHEEPMRTDGPNQPTGRRQRWDLFRAAVRSGLRRYPRALVESVRRPPPAARPDIASLEHIEEHCLAAAWLGHGTVLAQLGETSVLIDPVFSSRIGMRLGKTTLGPKRLKGVPVAPEGLPPIDILLITHSHFDHLDKPTLRQLASENTIVVTALGTRRLIPRCFRAIIELGAGQTATIRGLELLAIAPAHWGSRKVIDRHRKYNSYLVKSPNGCILFAGDTGLTDAFKWVSGVDLAVFGIGAYDPWEHMHATPEQVWSMFRQIGANWLLPVHHSTFELGDEPVDEPMQRLLAAADGHVDRIIQVDPGELWVDPAAGNPSSPSADLDG